MLKHFKSVHFVFSLIGLLCSLFIIIFAACSCYANKVAYIGIGIICLISSINNFIVYFKKDKKQRKEESASAKLKLKGE